MKTTQRQLAYSRKPNFRNASPSLKGGPPANTLSDVGHLSVRKAPHTTSPAIALATHNAGLTLYEILALVELIRVAYEKGELTSVEARLSHLVSEAASLTSSVSNILALMKLEAGQSEKVCEHFDIVALLHEVSEAARMIIGNKSVTVMDVSCPSPVVIHSDRAKIRQIMTELMSNAAKFTDRGRIALILNKTDDAIRLTVADTGKGMTQEKIRAVFGTSCHGYDVEMNGLESSGLGLRIVKSLVKKLEGTISVSSKAGEGTIVEVSFPLDSKKF
jgi:cell cycle sensor histidine kinase DivJ